jgi:hypothetical protein
MVARGRSYHSPIFCFLKREGEEKGWVLGHNPLAASRGKHGWRQCMFSGGVLRVWCFHIPSVALERLISLDEELIESLVGG